MCEKTEALFADAEERFAPVREAMIARGWNEGDVYVEHTGGNVFALALVLLRDGNGRVMRQALLSDPDADFTWSACIESADGSVQIDDLGEGPSTDDLDAGAHWLDEWLEELGYPTWCMRCQRAFLAPGDDPNWVHYSRDPEHTTCCRYCTH